MINKNILHITLLVCLSFLVGQITLAEQATDPIWKKREATFLAITKTTNHTTEKSELYKEASLALISLLEIESEYERNSSELDEDYTDYYADLIYTVASLHDVQSINVLLKENVLTTGNIAINGLAVFGDKIINKILVRFNTTKSEIEKVALIRVLNSTLIAKNIKEPGNRNKVKMMLLKAAKEDDKFVHLNAERGLSYFGDVSAQQTIHGPNLPNSGGTETIARDRRLINSEHVQN